MVQINFINLLFCFVIGMSQYCGDCCEQRYVVEDGKLWQFDERDFNFVEKTKIVSSSDDFLVSATPILFDCSGDVKEWCFEFYHRGKPQIAIGVEKIDAKSEVIEGENIAFNSKHDLIALFKIDPESIKDAFFLRSRISGEEFMLLAGGFYEPFPIVSSQDYFFIFRSDENQTLQINAETYEINRPKFLNKKVVLDVWGKCEKFLVLDRLSRSQQILDSSGQIICSLELSRGDQSIGFSLDGDFIYVSKYRIDKGFETRDLVAYKVDDHSVAVLKENFSVGLGKLANAERTVKRGQTHRPKIESDS